MHLPREAPDVGTGEVGSVDSGAMTRIQVRIDVATERIVEAVFKVIGGHEALASANLVAERLQGATIAEAREMDGMLIVAELELPIERAHVAGRAVEAALAAIDDWERKQ